MYICKASKFEFGRRDSLNLTILKNINPSCTISFDSQYLIPNVVIDHFIVFVIYRLVFSVRLNSQWLKCSVQFVLVIPLQNIADGMWKLLRILGIRIIEILSNLCLFVCFGEHLFNCTIWSSFDLNLIKMAVCLCFIKLFKGAWMWMRRVMEQW